MATPTGKFVWYEYMGNDLKAAADFYTYVVGWTAKDAGMPGFAYEILSAGRSYGRGHDGHPRRGESDGREA